MFVSKDEPKPGLGMDHYADSDHIRKYFIILFHKPIDYKQYYTLYLSIIIYTMFIF